MEKAPVPHPPKFLRQFSKEHSGSQRMHLAAQIRQIRLGREAVRLTEGAEVAGLSSELESHQSEFDTAEDRISQLEAQVEEISHARFGNLRTVFMKHALKSQQQRQAERSLGLGVSRSRKQEAEAIHKETESEVSRNTGQLIENFYDGEAKKWADSEFSPTDIRQFFNEDYLSKLSVEDYQLLVRRFPRHMLAHVTRQGIRDHVGHMYHVAGMDEYHTGFMEIAKDGRLRSPLGVYIAQGAKDEAVSHFLDLDSAGDRQEAEDRLKNFFAKDQGSYADRMAIHFAAEEVADMYYGSERANEIFIAYPSALIAAQYRFNGNLTKDGGGYWNDQWVWANEARGISLDAGLVFIPKHTPVDKKTGSRYELDEDMHPKVNEAFIVSVRNLMTSDVLADLSKIKYELPASSELNRPEYKQEGYFKDLSSTKLGPMLNSWRQRLAEEFGITDQIEQMAILTTDFVVGLETNRTSPSGYLDKFIGSKGLYYVRAKDTIPAEDFWSDYFAKNPKAKPLKIVFYSGDDPTRSLKSWQTGKYSFEDHLGFKENHVSRASDEALAGADRFRSIAERVIDERFPEKKAA